MSDALRYEVKFVLNEREFAHALSWMSFIGAKKKFSSRTVNSLYFDNIAKESLQHNLAGIAERDKVRLRWYGDNFSENSEPKLEIKSRDGRLGSKLVHRLSVKINTMKDKRIPNISEEIFQQIRSANIQHNSICDYLVPVLLVNYEREYFEIINGVRITIDKKIKFFDASQNVKLTSLKPTRYTPYVLEIKFSNIYKNQVSDFLSSTALIPKRHSKYVAGLASLGYASYI